jgi:integrase
MSIEKTPDGAWRVRWREAGRNRSRVIGRKRDAEAFDAEMRRRRRMGEIASFDGGKMLLADFAREEWWPDWAEPNLAPATLKSYAGTWDKHVLPRVGGVPLRELTLPVCQRFASDLVRDGVGPATRHRAIVLLGSVMQRAVEWGRIPANPVRRVRKPPQRREREVRPLSPTSVEALRRQMGPRDAALVSVLAYVGPRPAEALRLRWSDVGERSIRFHATKTRSRRVRAARLMTPVRADLVAWKLLSAPQTDDALVFPRPDGEEWRMDDLNNWRNRVFRPALTAVGLPTTIRPYDLRHSAASLWLHEGRSVVEVAQWLGHAPSMSLDTYGHVMVDLSDTERRSAEDEIRAARGESVPARYLEATGT